MRVIGGVRSCNVGCVVSVIQGFEMREAAKGK